MFPGELCYCQVFVLHSFNILYFIIICKIFFNYFLSSFPRIKLGRKDLIKSRINTNLFIHSRHILAHFLRWENSMYSHWPINFSISSSSFMRCIMPVFSLSFCIYFNPCHFWHTGQYLYFWWFWYKVRRIVL